MTDEVVVSASPNFLLARSELLTGEGRNDAEGWAVSIVRDPHQRLMCTCVAPSHVKRFDIWIGDHGIVTHAAAATDDEPSPGMVAPATLTDSTIAALIVEGVGGLPAVGSRVGRSFANVDDLTLAVLNSADPNERVVLFGRRSEGRGGVRLVAISSKDGGSMARDLDVGAPVEMRPSSAPLMWAAIVDLLIGTGRAAGNAM